MWHIAPWRGKRKIMRSKDKANRRKMSMWIGVPFQMVATIVAGYWAGSWLDEKYAVDKRWWTIGLTLLAVLISLYQLISQVRHLENDKEEKSEE